MNEIEVIDSDFLSKTAMLEFSDGEFRFTKTAISSEVQHIPAKEIKSLNRLKPMNATKASTTNTNVFMTGFVEGAFLGVIKEFLGFMQPNAKKDRPIHVHFNDGKYMHGMTDLDTFLEVENAWLEAKG